MKIKIVLLVGLCVIAQCVSGVEINSKEFCENFKDVAFAIMLKRQIGEPIELLKNEAKGGTKTSLVPVLNRMIDYAYTVDVAQNDPSKNELSYKYAQSQYKACVDGYIPEFNEITD